MKNINPLFLAESFGEYPEYDKILNSFFGGCKIWWHQCQANFTFFKSCKELPKESNLINSVIKGLNIKVYAYPDGDQNAFVIPGFYVGADENYDMLVEKYHKRFPKHDLNDPFCIGGDFFSILLSSQLSQLVNMRKFTITNDSKNPGKKIAIFKNISTPISIFSTYGLLQNADIKHRLGIYLHEFGHWIDAAKHIPDEIIRRPEQESCFLYLTQAYQRFVTRYEELAADRFAKELGYGKELSEAFDDLINVRKNVIWYRKFGDWMAKKTLKQMDEDEENGYTDVYNYPSMSTRKKYLEDDK